MGNAIGTILPQAIGVAISPVPIIAVILMLFSQRARSNGPAFLLGWVLALAVVGSIVLVLANLGKISTGGTPSTLAYVLKLHRDARPGIGRVMGRLENVSTGEQFVFANAEELLACLSRDAARNTPT